jgi:hypothetical protein
VQGACMRSRTEIRQDKGRGLLCGSIYSHLIGDLQLAAALTLAFRRLLGFCWPAEVVFTRGAALLSSVGVGALPIVGVIPIRGRYS